MWEKWCLRAGVLLSVLFLSGCGAKNPAQEGTTPAESTETLTVEAGGLELGALEGKIAGGIQEADGYYVLESVSKSAVPEADWNKALEPFADILELRLQDPSFDFEGKDELGLIQSMFRDKQGYVYVVSGGTVLMIDPDGKVAARRDYGSGGNNGYSVGEPVISDTGEIVFPVSEYENNTVTIVSFDRQTGKERVLGRMEDRYFRNPLCALRGNKLFYRSNEWIVSWDLSTGERVRYFDLKNVGTGDRNVVMGFDEEGVPLLYIGDKTLCYYAMPNVSEEMLVATLGSQPPETKLTIRISDLEGDRDNGFVASCVGSYQAGRQDIHFDYQTCRQSGEEEAYRTRVLAEIADGNAADIFCVNRDNFYMLWQKGMIADLGDMVSKETLDALLPGVLELGTAEGKTAGIVPLVYATALAVSGKDWDKDSWTLKEFMEQTRRQGKKYAWVGVNGSRNWASSYEIMQFAGIPGMESMGLIDYQNHRAKLDGEEYMELLRFCREYGMTADLSEDEYESFRQNRESMATIYGFLYSFHYYEMFYELYGEDCKVIGFPGGDTGCNNYFSSPKWLVVSKQAADDAEKRKEISAFFEYLLSENAQKGIRYYLGVRKPTEENYYEIEDENFDALYAAGYEVSKRIVVMGQETVSSVFKSDKSTYLKEYMDFLESCRARPYVSYDVEKIILEEAGVFFDGGRSAEETARITQNRVQLYLDETD